MAPMGGRRPKYRIDTSRSEVSLPQCRAARLTSRITPAWPSWPVALGVHSSLSTKPQSVGAYPGRRVSGFDTYEEWMNLQP